MDSENSSNSSTILWGIVIVVGGYWIYRGYQVNQAKQIIASPKVQERMEAIQAEQERRNMSIVDSILSGDNKPWIPWR